MHISIASQDVRHVSVDHDKIASTIPRMTTMQSTEILIPMIHIGTRLLQNKSYSSIYVLADLETAKL